MEEIVINAKKRDVIGKKVKVLRREGILPAIVYGRGFDPVPILMDFREVSRTLQSVSSSHLVVIDIEGDKRTTLVRERQRDPITSHLLHLDFQEVSMTETLRTMVSIELVGDAPAVKEYNGILTVGQEQVEVESLPGDLPDRLEVDMSVLKEIGDAIYVRDLVAPPKVDILTDPEELLILVSAPAAEPVEEEELEEELFEEGEEPEVIERGKREEGEEKAGEE